MKFKLYIKISLSILLMSILFHQNSLAQKFEGAPVLGLTASQIDGDMLWGYNKLGLTGGVKLAYALKSPWFVSLELLYSQRGSQSKIVPFSNIPIKKINLQYIEIPFLIMYKDWYVKEDKYYKVNAEAGISYAYLFNSSISEGSFTVETSDLLDHDISMMLGVNYFINKHWGFGVRGTRSFIRLYENPNTNERDLLSYFLSFRAMYQF